MPSLMLPDHLRRTAATSTATAKESDYHNYLGSLQDQLLLWMRDGSWRKVSDAIAWLTPRMTAELLRDRYLAAGGVRDRKLEHQFGEGKKLVIEDVVDSLRRRKLAAFRECEGGEQEIRSTPLVDPRFEIDPEFKNLLPRADDEMKLLEAILLNEEVRDPLVVWKGEHKLLVDGYARFHFCALLGRKFPIKEMDFADRQAVVTWLWQTHYGRRSLSELAKAYVRGQEYLLLKSRRGGAQSKGQRQNVAESLAKKYGVSRNTILGDGKFAKALNRITELAGAEVQRLVLSRMWKWTRNDVRQLAKLCNEEIEEAVRVARKAGNRPMLPSRKASTFISPKFRGLESDEQYSELLKTLDTPGLEGLFAYWSAKRASGG